jgi:hypothetical protein
MMLKLVTLAAATSAAAGADAVAAATINADRSPETLLGDDTPVDLSGSTPELGDRRTLAKKCKPKKNTECCRDKKSKCAKWVEKKPTKCANKKIQGLCRYSCNSYWISVSDRIEFCYGPAYVGSKEELRVKMDGAPLRYATCKQHSQKKCEANPKCAWMAETSKCLSSSDHEKCFLGSACYAWSKADRKADPDGYAQHRAACKESKKQCKADPACGWEQKVRDYDGGGQTKVHVCAFKEPTKPFCGDFKYCVAGTSSAQGECTQAASFDEDGDWSFPWYAYAGGLTGNIPCETDADCSTCTWDGSWVYQGGLGAGGNMGACRCQTGHEIEDYQCGGKHAHEGPDGSWC